MVSFLLVGFVTCIDFSFSHLCLLSLLLFLPFCFFLSFRRYRYFVPGTWYFVCRYSWLHGFRYAMYEVGLSLLLYQVPYPVDECVPCIVLWNWIDVNMMDTIILRLHPTRGSPTNACLVANVWYNCSARYGMRSEFGISARERPSGKKRKVLHHFEPAGRTRGSRVRSSDRQL